MGLMLIAVDKRVALTPGQIVRPGVVDVSGERRGYWQYSKHGKRYWVPAYRSARAQRVRIELCTPQGPWRGPFYVVREVTPAEYDAWWTAETGRTITPTERRRDLDPARVGFYEISLD